MSTLIIPAYDAAWCLEDCLKAVARQRLKPDEILIGVDACTETAAVALECQQKMKMNIRVLFFPKHEGCYRIRNTMALHATGEILHLFDADDLMEPDHMEIMQEAVEAGLCDVAMGHSMIEEEGVESRASGGTECPAQICLLKTTFIQLGGFEPWQCAADSEMLQRGTQAGLVFSVPADHPTFRQRKSPKSLTRRPETNMRSKLRAEYKAITHSRSRDPFQKTCLEFAHFTELVYGMEIPEVHTGAVFTTAKPPRPSTAVVVCAVQINLTLIRKWKTRNKDLLAAASQVILVTHPRAELAGWTKIIHYTEKHYSPAKAANAGIRWAADHGADIIVKTDIDCGLELRALDDVEQGKAIAPVCTFLNMSGHVEPTNTAPCGVMIMHTEDWVKLKGYDARQWGHGREDGELLERAQQSGITVERPQGVLYHMPHPPRITEEPDSWYPRRRRENIDLPDQKGVWDSDDWGLL